MSLRILLAATALVATASHEAMAAWTSPQRASRGPLPAYSPQVATNARGDAAAVWIRGARREAAIVVSLKPAGGSWTAPEAISRRRRPAIDPEVAVDARGRVVVVWRQVARTRRVAVAGVRRRQAVYVARARERLITDARWSAITTLSSRRQKVGPPELAIAADGLAVVAWHWGTGTAPGDRGYVGQVQFVERRADGSWTGPVRLSRSTLCTQVRLPRVAMGGRGHAAIWWQCDLSADRSTALAVARAPGDAFGAVVELPFRTDGGIRADLAIGPAGRVTAISAVDGRSLAWWRGDAAPRLALSALPVLGTRDRAAREAGPPAIAVNGAGDALSSWVSASRRPRSAPIADGLGVGAPSTLGASDDSISPIAVAAGDDRHGVSAWVSSGRVIASTRGTDGTMASGETISGSGVPPRVAPAVAMDAAGGATILWTRVVRGRRVVERASDPAP